jgi:hypothetical protein
MVVRVHRTLEVEIELTGVPHDFLPTKKPRHCRHGFRAEHATGGTPELA